ncbi:MAG: transposase [Myxococcales bacterium]|nr:transposase [Myxococcales bacterium]
MDEAKTGSLTFVQRFDSALRLNPHLHVLMLDGVYIHGEFFPLPAPSDDELIKMASDLSRKVLAHLCRYLSRPPVATQRLRRYRDGKLMYKLKRRFADGTEAVAFEPLDLISRLCALVLAPRFHLLRYHGVLAAHAKERRHVVLGPQSDEGENLQLRFWDDDPSEPSKKRIPWAKLLGRVFKVDVRLCPSCGGPIKIIEFVDAQAAAGTIRAPPTVLSVAPQLPLPFAG